MFSASGAGGASAIFWQVLVWQRYEVEIVRIWGSGNFWMSWRIEFNLLIRLGLGAGVNLIYDSRSSTEGKKLGWWRVDDQKVRMWEDRMRAQLRLRFFFSFGYCYGIPKASCRPARDNASCFSLSQKHPDLQHYICPIGNRYPSHHSKIHPTMCCAICRMLALAWWLTGPRKSLSAYLALLALT